MTKADMDKVVFSLLSQYSALYKKKYGTSPKVNKYKEKWGMKSLVEDFGEPEVEEVLNFYILKTNKEGHPLGYFYSNFDSILSSLNMVKRDKIQRSENREIMNRIRQEYLNGYA